MEEIIVEKKENSLLICVLENNIIVEKYNFTNESNLAIGNIYIGTIKDVFDSMQAAFVDIGLERKAFLPLKDAMPKIDVVKDDIKNDAKLSSFLKKEQNILLQVRKEAIDEKGARVSTHITLAGNYLVLMPNTNIITVSQKIVNKVEKERILQIIKAKLPDNFGCIIRTDAENISEAEIIEDLNNLLSTWKEIKFKEEMVNNGEKNCLKAEERLIYNDNNIALKIARDMVKKTTQKVYVNDLKIFTLLKKLIKEEILVFKENNDFLKEFGLYGEFEKIDNRKIWLDCGAQIVIDKTEALTAIDVNSSRYIGNEKLEDTIFKVNKEAAIEIMKQIRLKDIGGIIIIDFIDIKMQEHKNQIINIMKEESKKDRSKIEIKDFTQLNLVEMTRKKIYV